jgi:hypothetical protein
LVVLVAVWGLSLVAAPRLGQNAGRSVERVGEVAAARVWGVAVGLVVRPRLIGRIPVIRRSISATVIARAIATVITTAIANAIV